MAQLFSNEMESEELLSSIREVIQQELSKFHLELQQKPINSIGGIELAQQITGLARSTIYNLVSQRKIPFSKPQNSGRLYFVESDLRAWIQEGRWQTKNEIAQEVEIFLGRSAKAANRRN
ncbi:helix-turn-helix transcriptional regulator [Spirosoma radiotolerans]|uniref:helix-turn-helix transcriptional regulator n=1 Tax=Spirosoma radiotolerans TaxID=1379870 RepID=UPI00069642E4|nr:helix-turn-helix domain-containing protein [Spirosoma radiotolerans]